MYDGCKQGFLLTLHLDTFLWPHKFRTNFSHKFNTSSNGGKFQKLHSKIHYVTTISWKKSHKIEKIYKQNISDFLTGHGDSGKGKKFERVLSFLHYFAPFALSRIAASSVIFFWKLYFPHIGKESKKIIDFGGIGSSERYIAFPAWRHEALFPTLSNLP